MRQAAFAVTRAASATSASEGSQDNLEHTHSFRFGWRNISARLPGQAMASDGGHASLQQQQENGLGLNRMERVDASSQSSGQSDTASDRDEDSRSKLAKAVSSAERAWAIVWDWIKL